MNVEHAEGSEPAAPQAIPPKVKASVMMIGMVRCTAPFRFSSFGRRQPTGPASGCPSRLRYDGGMAEAASIQRQDDARPTVSSSEAARIVARTTSVDAVGLEGRAAALATRSIKRESKRWALDLVIRCMDLTTLEGSDTVGKIVALCAKAVRPDPMRPEVPSVAAVCLYPQLVPVAVDQLRGTGVAVASVAGGFPSGLGPLDARLQEIRDVAAAGADEIDIVLNRSLFLGGRYGEAFDELVAAREAAGSTHLKVILETGELGSYDRVRQASMLAMAASTRRRCWLAATVR